MRPETAARDARKATELRRHWRELSGWRGGLHGQAEPVSFGRCPLRIAIGGPEDGTEPRTPRTLEDCRAAMNRLSDRWPSEDPRLAIAGDTGLGKTTLGVRLCLRHAAQDLGLEGLLLYVVHDRQRVRDIVARLREEARTAGVAEDHFADLLGRQPIYPESGEDWANLRFGCKQPKLAGRAGRRGRRVQLEICKTCQHHSACRTSGFLAHTEAATQARVVVTTVAKLVDLPEALWTKCAAVICDEDVLAGLQREFYVLRADLARAARWIRRQPRRPGPSPRQRAFRAVLPLVEALRDALAPTDVRRLGLLVSVLPEECDQFATDEGHQELVAVLPRRATRDPSSPAAPPDPKAPAPWERARPTSSPRQVWGRLISALIADFRAGQADRHATIEIVRPKRAGGPSRLCVGRFDSRTVRRLRERPLLVLDATLHPAVRAVLDVEVHELRYDQGRTIVQALGPLGRLEDLCTASGGSSSLTRAGRAALAKVAAFFDGRTGYILSRPGISEVLRREATAFGELRRARFVTVKRERGWDAVPGASVFVVLGRYARNSDACVREARALRGLMIELTGTAAVLDTISVPSENARFRGRGQPVRYRDEPVERVTRQLKDRLAAALQDADRVAAVRQFIGRDRSGRAEVLLLRGDPTVGVDGLYDARDLPEAIPAPHRRHPGGRSVV